MKKLIILILLFILNIGYTFSQEEKASTPLESYSRANSFKIGILGGTNILLSPPVLVDKPSIASATVENSLLNGLNGLGFGATYNFGILGKYFISDDMNLGANIKYSNWNGINSCNCIDEIYKSENSLSLIQIGLFTEYFLWKNLYATAELGINLFGVKANENSKRGNLDFEESYTRIGLGLGLGYSIPITKSLDIDLTGQGQFPNLLLGQENTGKSESLINSIGETKEAMLFVLSFNVGLLYSF